MAPHTIDPTTVLELQSELSGLVIIHGKNCRLKVGANVKIDSAILIYSAVSNATIEIGDDCVLHGGFRLVRGHGGLIRIGAQTTFNDVVLSMHETAEINIGRDCMFGTDILMDPSDMHPIFDRTSGERLNPPRDINIGDHVWLGTRVLCLKGATIGAGTIVGAGSMVVGALPPDVMAVGTPARVVRENVVWTRDLDEAPELIPPEPPAAPGRGRWPWRRRD